MLVLTRRQTSVDLRNDCLHPERLARRPDWGAVLPSGDLVVGRHAGLYHRPIHDVGRRPLRQHVPDGLGIRRYAT